MAERIQRQTQKIFGGQAPTDDLAVFGSFKTGNPIYTDNIKDLQSTAYEEGWSAALAANEAPFVEEMNGVQYGFSKQLAYIFQSGIPEWEQSTEYFANISFCQLNGVWYKSLTDNNIGNNPAEDTTNWQEVSIDLPSQTNSAGRFLKTDGTSPYWSTYNALEENQITNCVLEVPNRINCTISNGTVTLKAGSILIFPYGLLDKASDFPIGSDFISTNLKVIYTSFNGKFTVWAQTQNDISLGPVGSYTGNGMISVNPANATIVQSGPLANCRSGATDTQNGNDGFYFDTTNYIITNYGDSGETVNPNISLPFAQVNRTSGSWDNIENLFNGFGYIGSHIWMDKDVKILSADGLNDDGTINNHIFETQNIYISNNSTTGSSNSFVPFIRDIGNTRSIYIISNSNYLGELDYVPKLSNGTFQYYFNTNEMKWYMHEAAETAWKTVPYYRISPPITVVNGNITSFKPYKPLQIADAQKVVTKEECKAYVIETYLNGFSGYIVYSNGYCRQWGYDSTSTEVSEVSTITLLKPYIDANYNIIASKRASEKASKRVWGLRIVDGKATTSSFQVRPDCDAGFYWQTEGYIF